MTDSTQIPEQAPAQIVPAPMPTAPVAPMPVPTIQPLGLSKVLDIKDKEGKVIGHYQWAFHKDGKADSLSVVKVVKDHDGNEQILYKTYKESTIAKKVMEETLGKQGIKEKLATVKAGEEYKTADGSVQNYGISHLLEFQLTGFFIVLLVLVTLWALITIIGKFVKVLGLGETKPSKAPSVAAPAQSKTIHPGMSDEQFAAVAGAAAAAHAFHPGMSDERFIAIISAAATHALGEPVSVVRFKPLNTMDWTWAVQGRVALHSHKV